MGANMGMERHLAAYEASLRAAGFSERTIGSYVWVAAFFGKTYGEVGEDSLRDYRSWLVETFKPVTANQRIQAINRYLSFLGRDDLRLRTVRMQQRTYLERTVSDAEFEELTSHLRAGGHDRDYHAVRIMATTGVRVSELLSMQVEDVRRGYMDVSSKGKTRRVHVPSATQREVLAWVACEGRGSGTLLLNRYGKPLSARGLSSQLKTRARECGVDEDAVHPHAFRHLFARKFLEAGGDLVLLSDLLGHSSVDTTRVYLRLTAKEQHEQVDRLVVW